MTVKMKAAVVEQFQQPLVLREWDIPSPGPGQIVVKTEACGVCHTDLHAANGDWPLKPIPPFIPGHEAIGIVTAVGSGVTLVQEGDRVGVPWLYSACGHCEYCLSAWETVCPAAEFGGYTRGPRLINDSTREEMRKILHEIQDGSFTRELVEEFDAGKPNFLKRREAERAEQIEQVGARLRPLMSWLDNDE